MTTSRRKNRDTEGKFFLYVFFFHLYSGLLKLFHHDD